MASYDHILFENTDMTPKIVNLRNKITKVLVEGATVTAIVYDSTGTPVTGISNPIVFVEQVGYKGLYHGALPDTASLVDGDTGTILFVTDAGAGLHREWTETYVVRGTTA